MQEDEAPPELRPFSLFSALCYRDPPGNVSPPPRRGGACASRWFPEGFHVTRRVSPFGATSFALGGKGGKTPPGVSRGRLPAPAGPSPDPRLRGPNSRGLPVTVGRGRDNDCPRNRAAAAAAPKSRRPGQLDQTGAPDCSRSNLCGGESAGGSGTRPYGAISVMGDTMATAAYETDSVSP